MPGVALAVAPNNQLMLINDPVRQVFYIYVPEGGSSSDYQLLKLNRKGNRRVQTGSLSGKMGLGGKAGVKSDKEMSFISEHVGIRTYKVALDQDSKPGEYALFMATGQQVGATEGRGHRVARHGANLRLQLAGVR